MSAVRPTVSIFRHLFRNAGGIGSLDFLRSVPQFNTRNLPRLLDVIEATCDAEFARMLLTSRNMGLFHDREVQRLVLIARIDQPGLAWQPETKSAWKDASLAPIEWIDIEDIAEIGYVPIFRPQTFGYVAEQSLSHTERVPRPKYAEVSNVEIEPNGLLRKGKTILDCDPVRRPHLPHVAGQWDMAVGSSANMSSYRIHSAPRQRLLIHSAISLLGRVDSNWFHWLLENMPRIILVDGLVDPSIPIVVSDQLSRAGVDALRAMSSREIIRVPADWTLAIERCVVPGPIMYHPDTHLPGWAYGLGVNLTPLRKLSRGVRGSKNVMDPGLRQVYWSRSGGARGLENQEQVRQHLEHIGFETVNPEKLDFWAQVSILAHATHVVSPGGAVVANFPFLQEGARITALTSEFTSTFPMPAQIALAFGHSYASVEGTSIAKRGESWHHDRLHRSFHIPIGRLENALTA